MSFHIVHFDDVKPQPWKNGGGVTRELLAWPNADEWAMRLSVADIECDGPFSAFPGIDRWFAVLSGNGVRLSSPAKTIQRSDDALHFDGALAPDCELIDGSTRDLNLMIRRDTAIGWMKRVHAGFEFPSADRVPSSAEAVEIIRGVLSMEGCTLQIAGLPDFFVEPMSLAWRRELGGSEQLKIVICESASPLFGFQCKLSK